MKLLSAIFLSALCLVQGASASPAAAGSNKVCSQHVISFATGIHLNIVGQHAELNGTNLLIQIESSTPVNHTAFLLAKGELVSDIAAGINIRKFVQAIAPKNNPANSGITKYANAQAAEQMIAQNLTGDPKTDDGPLKTLQGDIMKGIKLNQSNLKKATSVCDFDLTFPSDNL